MPSIGIHPSIIGLLREMPKPGSVWSIADREKFMAAMRDVIDFIYESEPGVDMFPKKCPHCGGDIEIGKPKSQKETP